jgi:enediyne biosynthesis protein E4
MGSRHTSRTYLLAAGTVGAIVLAAAGGWLLLRGRPEDARARRPFRESAQEAGLTWRMSFLPDEQGRTFKFNLYDHGSGLAVGDFDGDGREDVYFCNQLGPNALYRNKGDGTFEEVAEKAGVALGDRVCAAATFVDYDNDGRQDLFVTSTRGGNVLFRNNGDGTFKDVTKEAGLEHVGHSQTAVFFDYDNDGFLDLFLTNTAEWTTDAYDKSSRSFAGKDNLGEVLLSRPEHSVLYHNEPVDPNDPSRGRKFADVTEKAGVKGRGWAADAVAFDYNEDGRIDLFVTGMIGGCQLYRNNGDGTFTDVTREALGRTSWGAIGARAFDANNDGRLDLYVVDMHSDMWMGTDWDHKSLGMALQAEKKKFSSRYGPFEAHDPVQIEQDKEFERRVGYRGEDVLYGNTFFRNEGGGKFTEVSDQVGLETFWPWGIATGDFDNDGWEDVFLPSGMGYPYYYWPNPLLMNQGGGTFANRAEELGIEPPPRGKLFPEPINGRPAARSSRCAVTGDFRGTGLLDIVVNNFNDQPYYFKNQFPRKNWVEFRLRGTKSNRDAVGAVVRLYRGDQVLTRQVHAACGYLSHSSRTLHFGLGDRPDIERVEVTWPGGRRQRLDGVTANRMHDLVEPEEQP